MGRIPRTATAAATAVVVAALAAAGCSDGTKAPRAQPSSSPPTTSAPATSIPTGSKQPPPIPGLPDWPTYHGSTSRAGAADTDALRPPLKVAWRHDLDGKLYAQPIVAANRVIAATENNTLYALDPRTGAVEWSKHLAPPARLADLPCGNIDPSGITGTPAYDARSGLVFAVTESTGAQHVLWAVDVKTGKVRWRIGIDAAHNRDRKAEQQRGAVLVINGRVVVAFGGRYGDCGNYVGYVVSVATTGSGPLHVYAVPTAREAGIWAAAGPIVGPGGDIYVASGNGAEVGGNYDGSDSVIRLSNTLQRKGFFAPSVWPDDNADDLDLGSMSPVAVGNRIVIAGKRGIVYLLDAALGGIGGQVASIDGCAGYGGAAVAGGTAYLPCADGVRALAVTSAGRLHWQWGPVSGLLSPALAHGVVYALGQDDGMLVELDARTGHRRGSVAIGEVTRFATPAPVGRYVFVGTTSGVVAVVGRS
jgi:outer membrane protein assembly factor BamB